MFVETGPKRALWGFASDVLPDAVSLFTNHPKVGELTSFNQALCGLYALMGYMTTAFAIDLEPGLPGLPRVSSNL